MNPGAAATAVIRNVRNGVLGISAARTITSGIVAMLFMSDGWSVPDCRNPISTVGAVVIHWGVPFIDCVDASAYNGIKFTISGTLNIRFVTSSGVTPLRIPS